VDRVGQDLLDTAPALAFLCLGVPYAALLDRLGAFDAAVGWLAERRGALRTGLLWALAAVVTALLNLDTTIVLLTPIAVRLARRSGTDPVSVAAVPLLLSGLASSFLPVSNLTTLIAQGRTGMTTADVLVHLAPASVAAVAVGWLAFRRRAPRSLPLERVRAAVPHGSGPGSGVWSPVAAVLDPTALRVGALAVIATVAGFVVGPTFGIEPWMVLLVVDAAVALHLRWLPWREVPVGTAAAIGALVAAIAALDLAPGAWARGDGAGPAGAAVVAATAVANVANNLPATVVGFGSVRSMSDGSWGWLWGVNAGSLLLPWGTLATVLWWRVLEGEGVTIDLRRYAATVVPVAVPALVAGTVVLLATLAVV
jgi:arsenical pump membrane protein